MNKKVVLASRPVGDVKETDFRVESDSINTSLKAGEVLVRVEWVSIDPAQRVWISGVRSYIPPIAINQVIRSMGTGNVIASRSPIFKRGDYVTGFLGWQEFSIVNASDIEKLNSYQNPQLSLGVFGLAGLTAYFSIIEVAKAKAGETIVISTAAGSVGSIACQIGKLLGCKVYGICGSDTKGSYLANDLKLDGWLNYKTEKNIQSALRTLCPKGIDVYIDHVGGKILDAVLANIKKHARIVLSGAISSYNQKQAPPIYNYSAAISRSADIEGFIVWDFREKFEEARQKLAQWVQEKKIIHKEHIIEGVENAPKALKMLLNGENTGKMMVRVVHDVPRI